MDNFRTVAAVLVVLFAFTGFQFIANHSLRKAVQRDIGSAESRMAGVIGQIAAADAKVRAAHTQLAELDGAAARLAESLKAVTEQVNSTGARSAELEKSVDALQAKVAALSAGIDAMMKKLGALDRTADSAQATQERVKSIQTQVSAADADARSASQNASGAAAEIRKLTQELAQHRQAVNALADLKKDIEGVRNQLRQLSSALETPR